MSKARIATFAAASITAVLLLTGCSSTPSGTESSGSSSVPSAEVSAEANAADEMFATMMIVHHEQAIEMSDVILAKNSVDPAVTELAQKIKDAQGPEIDRMNDWLKAWGASALDMGGMDHGDGMGGMMSEEDMAALEAADGPTASRLFLEQMIQHHEGAVEMAEAQVKDGRNTNAVELAEQIIEAQTAEIQEMQEMLKSL